MTSAADFAHQLSELLDLAHPPVAVTLDAQPATGGTEPIPAQPSGCCFWARAEHRSFDTQPADHANSSIRNYIHGFIDLNDAAAGIGHRRAGSAAAGSARRTSTPRWIGKESLARLEPRPSKSNAHVSAEAWDNQLQAQRWGSGEKSAWSRRLSHATTVFYSDSGQAFSSSTPRNSATSSSTSSVRRHARLTDQSALYRAEVLAVLDGSDSAQPAVAPPRRWQHHVLDGQRPQGGGSSGQGGRHPQS